MCLSFLIYEMEIVILSLGFLWTKRHTMCEVFNTVYEYNDFKLMKMAKKGKPLI